MNQLTQNDLLHLTKFAERRLRLGRLSASFGEDLVYKALNSVIRGLTSSNNGRRPRRIDLVNEAAFLNYLRGAVCSTVEAFSRRREHWYAHLAIGCSANSDEFGTDELTASLPGDQRTDVTDLKKVLFARLREQAPEPLHRTIDLWRRCSIGLNVFPAMEVQSGRAKSEGSPREFFMRSVLSLIQ